MGTSEVQAVFDLLYAFRDEVSHMLTQPQADCSPKNHYLR